MIKVSSQADKVCVAKVHEAGQEQVFEHWDKLSSDERKNLLAQLRDIDFQELKRLIQQHLHNGDSAEERVLQAAQPIAAPDPEADREDFELCRTLGEYSLKNGEVAFVTSAGSAGGEPTAEPVGLLPVGPLTGKSVFQLQSEKIKALNRRHKVSVPWLIFCHPESLETTTTYFKENGYFGLNCSDLHFFTQEMLPVVDRRGKLLLSAPGRLALGTKGRGGILLQILRDEHLQSFRKDGIKHICYFQADNPLIKVGDPVFLGLHIKNRADMSSKCVRRTDPHESVGIFCNFNGSLGVVEHTEIDPEYSERRTEEGSLEFFAANIANHVLTLDFLERLKEKSFSLPYHKVLRMTPHVNRSGRLVRPTEPTAIQFQSFICDALKEAKRAPLVVVDREEEFSPIRHTGGKDSPQTAQRDLSQLYARWLTLVCPEFAGNGHKELDRTVEISPLYAMDVAELKEKLDLPVDLTHDVLL